MLLGFLFVLYIIQAEVFFFFICCELPLVRIVLLSFFLDTARIYNPEETDTFHSMYTRHQRADFLSLEIGKGY